MHTLVRDQTKTQSGTLGASLRVGNCSAPMPARVNSLRGQVVPNLAGRLLVRPLSIHETRGSDLSLRRRRVHKTLLPLRPVAASISILAVDDDGIQFIRELPKHPGKDFLQQPHSFASVTAVSLRPNRSEHRRPKSWNSQPARTAA